MLGTKEQVLKYLEKDKEKIYMSVLENKRRV